MGERTSYTPGTFCWVELSTTDTDGASDFYRGLFGWEIEAGPIPGGGEYLMAGLDGRHVAGAMLLPDEQRAMGVPPNWLSYVSVADVDDTAARVGAAGGTVIAPPFDVMTAGRMAVVQDPQGAVLGVWQPGEHIGAQLVNVAGAFSLNQLNTPDPEAAARFYTEVFGWRIERVAEDPPYWGIFIGDRVNGGVMHLPPGGQAPPHWLVYFTAHDIDASALHIAELGGEVVVPATVIGEDQRILVARDPQGAYFALYEGRVDP